MLYSFVRPIATVALKTFFRKIFFSNAGKIPAGKAVIIAANHPSAFLEPCILACLLDQPLHFLVRGNLFHKPLSNKVLRALHMLPVYRTKDSGYAFVKQNYETFDACYDTLRAKLPIMILAEGHTKMEKRLQPLKKGTARLAFGALEKYPELEDIYIVPTGVNYTYADQFRSEAMIDFGDTISTRAFWDQYLQNPNTGIAALTEELRLRLEDRIVCIRYPEDDELVEQLLILSRPSLKTPFWPTVSNTKTRLDLEKGVADTVNQMPAEQKNTLKVKAKAYFDALAKGQLRDDVVTAPSSGFVHLLALIFGFLPFLAGYLLNFIPLAVAKKVADSKVRQIEFYSSVMVAVGMGAYLLYFILGMSISLLAGAAWWTLLWLVIPFLGKWSLLFLQILNRRRNFQKQKQIPSPTLDALIKQREELLRFDK